MSTFLEVVQDFVREAGGISGASSSVVAQTGEMLDAVNWVLKAYKDIQNKYPNWEFMRADLSFPTITSTSTYTAGSIGLSTLYGEWKLDDMRVYSTAIGVTDEQPLTEVSWDAFRQTYLMGSTRTQTGRPTHIAQKPDGSLIVWPLPDGVYTINGEYYKCPQTMSADADIPIIPVKYHDVIAWRALMFYAGSESAPDLYAIGEREYLKIISKMEYTELPEMLIAGPMA